MHIGWIVRGGLTAAAGGAWSAALIWLAHSTNVLRAIHKNNTWFRTKLHLKPEPPDRFIFGMRLALYFGAFCGLVAVAVGIGIIIARGL